MVTGTQRARADRAVRHGSLVLGAVVAGAVTLLAGLGALGERGIALVHHCVAGTGSFAWWGTRLAMVRHSDTCPEGTLALGGAPDDVAGVIAAVALPVVVLHGLAGLGALGVWRHLARCFRQLARLVRPTLTLRPARALVAVRPEPRWRDAVGLPVVRTLLLAGAQGRRGPPLVAA